MVGIRSFPIGWKRPIFRGGSWLLVSGRVYGPQLAENPRTNLCTLFEVKSIQNDGITHWHLPIRSFLELKAPIFRDSLAFFSILLIPPTNHKKFRMNHGNLQLGSPDFRSFASCQLPHHHPTDVVAQGTCCVKPQVLECWTLGIQSPNVIGWLGCTITSETKSI